MLVYPAREYEGRYVFSIAQEKQRNPRLGHQRARVQFLGIVVSLNLPYPKFIDQALPSNLLCGA